MINVVTSCSRKGWDEYGDRFVSTFLQYWPSSVKLHIVSEDRIPLGVHGERVEFHSLSTSASWQRFEGLYSNKHWVRGDGSSARPPGVGRNWKSGPGYSFRHDAYKFSKKVFAIELVAEQVKTGILNWVDADVVTFAPVPEEVLLSLLPKSAAVACLARVGYHSECGFVAYALDNPATHKFIKTFAALYYTGDVFKLAEWHDSWVFDWLRQQTMVATHKIPHRSIGHPFINSELGKYMDHLKGARKDRGRSNQAEQTLNRGVPYWQS